MGEGRVVTTDEGHLLVVQQPIDHNELQEAIFQVKLDRLKSMDGEEEAALKILLHNWAGHLATKINYDLKAGTSYGFEGPQHLNGSFGNSTGTPGYDSDILTVNTNQIYDHLSGKGISVKYGREIMEEYKKSVASASEVAQGGGKLKRRMKKSKRSKRKGKSKKKSKRTKKQQRKR